MRIIDLTNQSMGWSNHPQTRTTNEIKNIAIHHSATTTGNQMVFENHWRSLGWQVGGYSEIILPNGDVELCYAPAVVTNGVGDHNTNAYHICAVGNFRNNGTQPSAVQMASLLKRISFNMERFGISAEAILGHNEFANTARFNHQSNICPGITMSELRNQLRSEGVTGLGSNNDAAHTVQRGETLSGIAAQYSTTIAELQKLNNITNPNLIGVGQALQLPSTNNSIQIGTRVRINQNARAWATGQTIPAWVLGRTYIIKQIRNNGNELLLADIMSWIRRADVTPT